MALFVVRLVALSALCSHVISATPTGVSSSRGPVTVANVRGGGGGGGGWRGQPELAARGGDDDDDDELDELNELELKGKGFRDFELLTNPGSHGEIHTATWEKDGREVVLKEIPIARLGGGAMAGVREYTLQQSVWRANHGAVPELYGTGGRRGYFLIMEYLPGRSVAEALEEGYYATPRTKRQLIQRLWRLGADLEAAGVAHYDLRPENIVVRRELDGRTDRDQGGVSLLDFGHASDRQQTVRSINRYWASPEQYAWSNSQGAKPAPGPRSDVYTMAKIAYRVMFENDPPQLFDARRWRSRSDLDELFGDDLDAVIELADRPGELFFRALHPNPAARPSFGDSMPLVARLTDDDMDF